MESSSRQEAAVDVMHLQLLTAGLAVLVPLALLGYYLRSSISELLLLLQHTLQRTRGAMATASTILITDPDVARRMIVGHADLFSNHPMVPLPVDLDAGQPRTQSITSVPYGPLWRVLRGNLTANVVHPSRLAHHLAPLQRDAIGALVADLSSRAGEAADVVVRDGLQAAVFTTMAHLCFGDGVGERHVRAMQRTLQEFLHSGADLGLLARSRLARLRHWRQWCLLVGTRSRLARVFGPVIAARRQSRRISNSSCAAGGGNGTCSYVDSLLDLRIPNDGAGSECNDAGRALRDDEIVRLVWEFLAASGDTVVACVEWTLAHLVTQPEVQKKLHHELTSGQQLKGQRQAIDERLRGSPYLRAVILESLRLHPPIPGTVREVGPEGAAFAGTGTAPPPEGTLMHFLFVIDEIGRHPKSWTDPDEFRPERFLAGGEGEDVSQVPGPKEIKMMPFGAGRRQCPGAALAMTHIASILSALVREFEWAPPADGGGVDLTPNTLVLLKVMASPLRACIMPRMACLAHS